MKMKIRFDIQQGIGDVIYSLFAVEAIKNKLQVGERIALATNQIESVEFFSRHFPICIADARAHYDLVYDLKWQAYSFNETLAAQLQRVLSCKDFEKINFTLEPSVKIKNIVRNAGKPLLLVHSPHAAERDAMKKFNKFDNASDGQIMRTRLEPYRESHFLIEVGNDAPENFTDRIECNLSLVGLLSLSEFFELASVAGLYCTQPGVMVAIAQLFQKNFILCDAQGDTADRANARARNTDIFNLRI